ncbi:MAG TPA: hypothetical protein VN520_14295 [Streptomyces sp.]|uniref:hypothetical protein n=1 Tax=Streptomyces sp. TaxID=1931 RepID=UPI002B676C68|nr:hypothetical protein [Streptomyces sp.]HWU07528.1 hypothetical protein [Streptomyces sp.]
MARVPELAALLVAAGLAGLVSEGGMPLAAGLLVLAVAAVGTLSVSLAYCLPSLVTALTARQVSAPAPMSPIRDLNRVPVVSEPVRLLRLRE